jgi:hypothetical protein
MMALTRSTTVVVRWALVAVASATGAFMNVLPAQVVRGRVQERQSSTPVPGVVITLLDSAGSAAAEVLSDARGEYSVRAPASGRYRLDAKRIGVRRFQSDPFTIASGETRTLDVQLDAVLYQLPEVVVSSSATCSLEPKEAGQVAALWEEARTALIATRIAQRDRTTRMTLTNYSREVDTETKRVFNEQRRSRTTVLERPFHALSAESLSAQGYWKDMPDGSRLYYAPDAEVLLSDTFVRDHCFRVTARRQRGVMQVGLEFEPTRQRRQNDIQGVLWLDGRTFELRLVEFSHTGQAERSDPSGGEVHFDRLPTGVWFVRRWHIRMPQFALRSPRRGVPGERPEMVVVRVREEGGEASPDSATASGRGSLVGLVRDSLGTRPLFRATARLAGTDRQAPVRSDGRFLMDGIVPGRYLVQVTQPGYDSLGTVATEITVDVAEGDPAMVAMEAWDMNAVRRRVCPGESPGGDEASLRVELRHATSGSPLSGIPLLVEWNRFARAGGAGIAGERTSIQGVTNEQGSVVFCQVPARTEIPIFVIRETRRDSVDAVRLERDAFKGRTIRLPWNR